MYPKLKQLYAIGITTNFNCDFLLRTSEGVEQPIKFAYIDNSGECIYLNTITKEQYKSTEILEFNVIDFRKSVFAKNLYMIFLTK